jgi:hypothetical protein
MTEASVYEDAETLSFGQLHAKYIDAVQIGIPRSELERLEASGDFPKRAHVSGFWLRSEVDGWFDKNPERRPTTFVFNRD